MNPFAFRLSLLAILLAPTAALAADKAGCKPPAWAPRALPGFEISSCDERAWDTIEVQIGREEAQVSGHRVSVTYELRDSSKNPTAAVAREFYAGQAKKAGAVVSLNEGYDAYLKKSGPEGVTWYVYEHGGGNESSTSSYTLTTLQVQPLPQQVVTRIMPSALDVSGASCRDPAWLVKSLAGYKLHHCEAKTWDSTQLDLDHGDAQLEGRRASATYQLADDKQVVTALAAHLNFLRALQKSGAEVVRGAKPDDRGDVVAKQKTASGEFWYVWDQAGGSGDHVSGFELTTWQITPLAQEVEARPLKGALDTSTCADPPWLVKQFPYFKRMGCKNRDFDSVELHTRDGRKTFGGHVFEVNYTLTDEKKDPTAPAVWKNYVNALKKIGAELISDPRDSNLAVLSQKGAQGDVYYVYEHGSGNRESTTSYSLLTLQVGGPPPKSCKMEIYGVNFDFDKATLRPDSEPVLQAVLALFKSDSKLSGEIGGHTDNVGKRAYNMTLSGQRAEAVKSWLVAHGVASKRLTTHGYGDSRPLVPNTNDENRAKNRRVELTRENCRGK